MPFPGLRLGDGRFQYRALKHNRSPVSCRFAIGACRSRHSPRWWPPKIPTSFVHLCVLECGLGFSDLLLTNRTRHEWWNVNLKVIQRLWCPPWGSLHLLADSEGSQVPPCAPRCGEARVEKGQGRSPANSRCWTEGLCQQPREWPWKCVFCQVRVPGSLKPRPAGNLTVTSWGISGHTRAVKPHPGSWPRERRAEVCCSFRS